jgi:hypothetical protein
VDSLLNIQFIPLESYFMSKLLVGYTWHVNIIMPHVGSIIKLALRARLTI